jgi:hypothetical protein
MIQGELCVVMVVSFPTWGAGRRPEAGPRSGLGRGWRLPWPPWRRHPTATMICMPSRTSGLLMTVLCRSARPFSTNVTASFPASSR